MQYKREYETMPWTKISIREVVKTTLHARDPLLRGEGREETMGLIPWLYRQG